MPVFVLTEEELQRLPPIMREIVEVDRDILLERAADAIDFKRLGELKRRRAELREHIQKGRGHEPGGTGGTPVAMAA